MSFAPRNSSNGRYSGSSGYHVGMPPIFKSAKPSETLRDTSRINSDSATKGRAPSRERFKSPSRNVTGAIDVTTHGKSPVSGGHRPLPPGGKGPLDTKGTKISVISALKSNSSRPSRRDGPLKATESFANGTAATEGSFGSQELRNNDKDQKSVGAVVDSAENRKPRRSSSSISISSTKNTLSKSGGGDTMTDLSFAAKRTENSAKIRNDLKETDLKLTTLMPVSRENKDYGAGKGMVEKSYEKSDSSEYRRRGSLISNGKSERNETKNLQVTQRKLNGSGEMLGGKSEDLNNNKSDSRRVSVSETNRDVEISLGKLGLKDNSAENISCNGTSSARRIRGGKPPRESAQAVDSGGLDDEDSTSDPPGGRRSSESDRRVSENSRGGLVGLQNLGNTCFMNSILQCLSNTRPLLEYCLDGTYRKEINRKTSRMKGTMMNAFGSLLESLWRGPQVRAVSPTEFKQQISKFSKQFDGYREHDAHEFLVYLLEGLHEDVNRVQEKKKRHVDCSDEVETISAASKANLSWKLYKESDDSHIQDIFVGQLRSALTCKDCGYISNTFEPFLALSLPLRMHSSSLTLNDCFEIFSQEETLDRDNRPKCAKCRTHKVCTKRMSIQKFPQILVLHLMRFKQGSSSKLNIPVNCPLTDLNLSSYSTDNSKIPPIYNLFAVSNHTGTPYSGHYTACAKNPYTGQWHTFNDSSVSSTSVSRVESAQVYLLFYELQSKQAS